MSELPTRPPLRRGRLPGGVAHDAARRALEWVRWVGAGRVVGTSVVVLAVVAGGYWLLRPPALPVEAGLPYTAPSTTASSGNDSTITAATGAQMVVHVAGAVRRPGVYELGAGSRVIDAVAAAGGLAGDAAPDTINLAALLVDAQRIYVPHLGETPPTTAVDDPGGAAVNPVDLNHADAATLESLPGIGPTTAAAIIAYRESHGPFATVDELGEVTGIGPSKLAALRGLVTV